GDPAVDKPALRGELIDGSQLAAASYNVKQGTPQIELAGGERLALATRLIRTARFQDLSDDKLTAEWSKIVEGTIAGDLLVVRKKGALDYLEGVLADVDAESVHFTHDDESVAVKRPKVEGLVYYHARAGELPEAV